jgi:hypothetical protein
MGRRWLVGATVIGIRDPTLPSSAPRCAECGATVTLPGHLPERFYLLCQECKDAEDAW